MKYHKDIGFPNSIIVPNYSVRLIPSDHALSKVLELGIRMPVLILSFNKETFIELETKDNKKIDEVVIRVSYDENTDLCVSVKLFNKSGIIKTLWINNKDDQHKTLDKSLYDIPDNNDSKEIDDIYAGCIKQYNNTLKSLD